jgi:hypothetical protein
MSTTHSYSYGYRIKSSKALRRNFFQYQHLLLTSLLDFSLVGGMVGLDASDQQMRGLTNILEMELEKCR